MIYPGLPDDQQVLAAVGKIALRHGQLDYALKMTVRHTMRQGYTASTSYGEIAFTINQPGVVNFPESPLPDFCGDRCEEILRRS
jgi:hypothetical protein